MHNDYSVAAHWPGGFDEPGLQRWVEELRARLKRPAVDLGLVFMSPRFFPHAEQVLEILRVHGRIPLLAGCSSGSLIAGDKEIERDAGLVLGLYALPGAKLKTTRFTQAEVEAADGPDYWRKHAGVAPAENNGWLAFADPFHLDCESWLRGWDDAYAPRPILGGLASGDPREASTQVYLNNAAHEDGGVAISFGGDVALTSMISQGCTPIGEAWTITKAEQNLIHRIGNRRVFDVLRETFEQLSPREKEESKGIIFVGLAINEYLEDFHRGDFLVRNLVGADPQSGIIAVGALPRTGQTIQFQHRAAAAGTEDIYFLLDRAREQLAQRPIYGGCLCSCNGRGHRMFGQPHHDAGHVQNKLGPFGLAGFFCNGEIGPIGETNFLHGYTASLALFVKKA